MRRRHLLSLGLVGVFVVVSCGGDEQGETPGTSATTGSPATTTGGTQGTTTTAGAPQSDGGAIIVEIDGTRYEFSTRSDIPFPQAPDTMIPTRCEPNFFSQGVFWVIGVEVDSDGRAIPGGWVVESDLTASGGFDDTGFAMSNEDMEYQIVQDDLGSWSISGNRLQGEVNVYYHDGVEERRTTAILDFTCPG